MTRTRLATSEVAHKLLKEYIYTYEKKLGIWFRLATYTGLNLPDLFIELEAYLIKLK